MPVPFTVFMSDAVREGLRAVALTPPTVEGRALLSTDLSNLASALKWYADELGESREDFGLLGQGRCAQLGRVSVKWAVAVERRVVNVAWFRYVRPRGS